jgi:hypothetical protein
MDSVASDQDNSNPMGRMRPESKAQAVPMWVTHTLINTPAFAPIGMGHSSIATGMQR